jgi:NAD(P)-dependent dehydrogenase (short-subunit alcohol dehydrogenase family)/acyl carrier protein
MIDVVTNNIHNVIGEEVLYPAKAMVLAPCKVIPQEFPNIKCRNIDIAFPASGNKQEEILINQIMAELTIKPSGQSVAYRGGHRWLQTYEAVKADESSDETPRILRNGGIYLITGGLGGIGLVLSEYLARTVRAKLVLTGRSTFPAKNEWNQWLETHDPNDSVSRKIRKVQTLEDLGAEVVVCKADTANLKQMQQVINETYKRFGNLHGVVHAAGILPGKTFQAQTIQNVDQDACRQQFQPKVNGLIVLETVLQGRKCDFCLLTSSVSSVLGGLGFASYAAGNIFMDAFAQKHSRVNAVPWISVNWDAWQFENNAGRRSGLGASLAELAIKPEEGKEVFKRILSMVSMPQLVISTGKLQNRIERWVALESSPDTESSIKKELSPKHVRPEVSTAYVAPRNENEQAVAEIWQELLGIQRIGIHDNYFELGGDSLLAAQVISRLRDNFEIEFPLARIFETPTIAGLTELIETFRLTGPGPRLYRETTTSDWEEGKI